MDYASTYFEYPILDKIHGEPTFESLKRMKKQPKANAQAVPSTLGGGNHGLLGLVLTPVEYARVSNEAFTIPNRPGPLILPPFTANHDIVRLQGEHEQEVDTYKECIAVQKSLLKQIANAIEGQFLKEICDPVTNSLERDIPDVLQFLFENFGQVTSEQLAREEAAMNSFYWDINDPIVILLNKIDDLVQLADAANMPKTEAQIVNYGLDVIKKTNDFEQALREWFSLPAMNQTYQDFKQHFMEAHKELKKVRGPRLRDTAFHQANQVSELKAEFTRFKDELVTSINKLAKAHQYEQEHSKPPAQVPPPAAAPQANATSDVNAAILQLLKEMNNNFSQMNSGAGGKDGESPPRKRRNTSKYCFTHGACAHSSKDCRSPRADHKKEATFENKMGGSKKNCSN